MVSIECSGVSKVFDPPKGPIAVNDLSLTIGEGEFVTLVGPSGCGKSTLLRIIAGLERQTTGRIMLGDRDVSDVDPADRDVAMVFQSYALYPHMTVARNIGFGLKLRGVPKREAEARVRAVAETLGLSELLGRKPSQLSGGQRQRVAMGRAIIREPAAFLMDEPLSNLDAKLRVQMRGELARLRQRLGTTTIYVTHDQVEAMTLGDRVVVLRDGSVAQAGTPTEVYQQPSNLFVATFIGSPPMNLAHATVDGSTVTFGGWRLPLEPHSCPPAGDVIVGVRPADIVAARDAGDRARTAEVRVALAEQLGDEVHVSFAVDAPPVETDEVLAAKELQADADLLNARGKATFTAKLIRNSAVRAGDTIALSIDPAQLHFFDPKTGSAHDLRSAVAIHTAAGAR